MARRYQNVQRFPPVSLQAGLETLAPQGMASIFPSVRKLDFQHESLSGSLLVAHPALLDPNFRKAVLFLATNDREDGSMGFVLNRPMGKTVGDLLPDRDDLGLLSGLPVCLGGPVQADRLMFAAFHRVSGRFECCSHLAADEAAALSRESDQTVRAFIGYAGWSAGQLEMELKQRTWVLKPPDPEMLSLDVSEELWSGIMRDLGPYFRLMASAPEDPSLN